MGGFPVPTYTLVGKRTSGKTDLFKCIFMEAWLPCKQIATYKQQKCQQEQTNKLPKGPMNVACLVATISPDKSQQKIPTSHTIAMTASTTRTATDLALLPAYKGLEATFQTTQVHSTPENISAKLLSSKRKAPIPCKTAGSDKGGPHHALPIWGLLPDDKNFTETMWRKFSTPSLSKK